MASQARRRLPAVVLLAAALISCRAQSGLPTPETVLPGIRLYRLSDPTLLEPPGPVAVQMLRLDPRRVVLKSALSDDYVIGTETVLDTFQRHKPVAAINAGFFFPNGDPQGLLQVDGELVSDTSRPRGAIAVIDDTKSGTRLLFDVVTAEARVRFGTGENAPAIDIAGIDTTRQRGKLMLFTPKYYDHTDTAARGIEWIVDGSPPTVRERRDDMGSAPIPKAGFVLSYGGLEPPPELEAVKIGDPARIERRFATRYGTPPSQWAAADHVIGGAGLLVRNGKQITDWSAEDFKTGFATDRHPRTIVGVGVDGDIWLITIDGRNPQISLGMTFAELQRLAARLNLTDVLNLDGGGSTTMVVKGEIVNHPSDATGPRKVSDALLVFAR
jgi:exopolysaccharide biosynthesis protein